VVLFASTEIAYLITCARGVFDLLQECIAVLWKRVRLADAVAEAKRKQRGLPETFSKLILRDKQALKTIEEMTEKYGLTPTLCEAYAQQGAFFSSLRDLRDTVIHGYGNKATIFVTDKGFCISSDERGFRNCPIWNDSYKYNDNLVSLLPLLAHVVVATINACSELAVAFTREINFPPEMAPGYHIFVRSPYTSSLHQMLSVFKGGSPWWVPDQT